MKINKFCQYASVHIFLFHCRNRIRALKRKLKLNESSDDDEEEDDITDPMDISFLAKFQRREDDDDDDDDMDQSGGQGLALVV